MIEEILIAIPVCAAAIAAWSGTVYWSSRVTDWRLLSAAYPDRQPPHRYTARFRSGRVGDSPRNLLLFRYRFMFNLHAGDAGLHLAMILPMRPGHAPICIPWSALRFAGDLGGALEGIRLDGTLRVDMNNGTTAYLQLEPATVDALGLRQRVASS